ncbi:NUDIX domain-containing protein [Streptomyces violascens]|uniref:NUDIX domain-containing protein n=1 Tax=Streptomyces violascens TaxID=67381 RepID=UPI0036B1BBED
MQASGLVLDTRDRVLVLTRANSPSLGVHRELPGTLITQVESPGQGLARIMEQDLGVDAHSLGRLLAVDCDLWTAPSLAFIVHLYLVGPLDEDEVAAMTVAEGMTASWQAPEVAIGMLPEPEAARVRAALAAFHTGSIAHLVTGRVQPGSPAGLPSDLRALLERDRALGAASHRAVRPKILADADVLFTDSAGGVLLVRPAHREDGWFRLPGGGIDSDLGEGPREAARRRVRAELGLDLPLGRLLAVDWENLTPFPSRTRYVFHGGTLGEHDLARIRLNPSESAEWRMATPDELPSLVAEPGRWRIEACLTAVQRRTGPLELRYGTPGT